MGLTQVKLLQQTVPLVDIEQIIPPKKIIIVRNIGDDKYYLSTGYSWKLIPLLNEYR